MGGEPGVDVWHGTFPSEESAAAWSAVDRLARQYVLDGTCPTIERARAKALTDLVLEHSDVEVRVVLTVPADTVPHETLPAETLPAETLPAETVPAQTAFRDAARTPPSGGRDGRAAPAACSAVPSAEEGDDVPDGVASRLLVGDEDLVQVFGARPSEPVFVPAGWLRRHTAGAARAVCDPATGARLDPGDDLRSDAYRPGDRLAALVRARDGGCRFPGCRVAARFCDLDHVRSWPSGPTAASNLVCLCRRHHRVKQSAGWRLRLLPDGVAEWTDPTGEVRRTEALDALDGLVLRPDSTHGRPRCETVPERAARLPSILEERLDHLVQCREAARRAVGRRTHPTAPREVVTSAHDPPPF